MLEELLWTDYFLLIIILLSTVFSIRKGFFEEFFSILSIVIAVVIAFRYSDAIATFANGFLGEGTVSMTIALIATFFILYLGLSKISKRLVKKIKRFKFSVTDKLLGVVFGFVRGVFIVVIIMALGLLAPYVKNDGWLHTPLTDGLNPLKDGLMVYVPDKVEKMLKGQVKSFEDSEFVNQTKKLFNAAFDADLEIRDSTDVTESGSAAQDTETAISPEQLKEDLHQKAMDYQKTRLMQEGKTGRRIITDLQRPKNPVVNSSESESRLFQKPTSLKKEIVNERELLLKKLQEQEELKKIEEMKKHHDRILKEQRGE